MDSDDRGIAPSRDTEDQGQEPGDPDLPAAVRGRLSTLLSEFSDAAAMMEQVITVLESVTGSRPSRSSPALFGGARKEAQPSMDVRLEVVLDSPGGIDDLHEALSDLAGVQRVRLSKADETTATFSITLDASPTRSESVITFREALSGIAGARQVRLTEFVDDHATFVLSVGAAGLGSPALEAPSVVCAWCGRLLTIGSGLISHGICRTCASRTASGAGAPGGISPPPLVVPENDLVYMERGTDVWLERRQERGGRWVTSRSPYAADLPAQTILEGMAGKYPDRLVVLAGQDKAVAEPSPAGAPDGGATTPGSLQGARPRRLSGRRPRVPAESSLGRLRQTLRQAVPVDRDLLLEELASVQAVVDGLAHRQDLPHGAARDLSQSLDSLQDTINSIRSLAGSTETTPRS